MSQDPLERIARAIERLADLFERKAEEEIEGKKQIQKDIEAFREKMKGLMVQPTQAETKN